jgi:hypothetical protein
MTPAIGTPAKPGTTMRRHHELLHDHRRISATPHSLAAFYHSFTSDHEFSPILTPSR